MNNMTTSDTPRIHVLSTVSDAQVQALADLLIDCVEGGASVSFMLPLARERALVFWRKVADGVARGERALLVAEDAEGLLGTVQLVLDQPENQPHRAEVSKMLVYRRARRRGIGALLMQAAEDQAHAHGKTLLVLDTSSAEAERLYARMGWQRVGVIPGFALLPEGEPCSTTFFYRALQARAQVPAAG
jgi:GNAT superfamily N-acetyltransferase